MFRCSWIIPRELAASSSPVHAADLWAIAAQGVCVIVTLTEQPLTRFATITPEVLASERLELVHLPIRDHHAPDAATVQAWIALLAERRRAEQPVLVHCAAGVGRTGTMLGLALRDLGFPPAAVWATLRRQRPQCLLLSAAQRACVEGHRCRLPISEYPEIQ